MAYRRDLRELQFSRSIEYMVTGVRVYHGLITGTITGLTSTTLTDSGATFITNSVKPGDLVSDQTVGGSASILKVDSQTQLTIGPWRAKVIGRATGGSTTTLIDSTKNFVDEGVIVNDKLVNLTDDYSEGTITGFATTVNSNDTLQISGAMSGGKSNGNNERYEVRGGQGVGDAYAIRTAADTNFVEADTTTVNYWYHDIAVSEPSMDATQALQYANALLIDEPQQVQSFTIGSPYVRDANGALWPLLEMIAQAARAIKIADLYPDASTLTGLADKSKVFYITSMEYSGEDNTLRLSVDRHDRRLDYRLRRERILGSAGLF